MESVLMVVTLVALALAMGMSVLAWRLLREDRQRSSARSDTLRELAADIDEVPEVEIRRAPPVREREIETRPSPRRAPRPEPAYDQMRFKSIEDEVELPGAAVYVPEPTFSATEERGAPTRRWAALAAVAVVMAGAVGSVYALYRPQVTDAIPSMRELTSSSTPAASPDAHPIELLSLRHAANNDGSFTVTGLVQNPYGGRVARHVIAVVYLFDRDGNYFASGKAALDFTALEPGEESPFVVHVRDVGRVSRYRVGFRSEEGGVVAHVDRRGQLPGGTTGDAIEVRPTVTPTAARRSEGL